MTRDLGTLIPVKSFLCTAANTGNCGEFVKPFSVYRKAVDTAIPLPDLQRRKAKRVTVGHYLSLTDGRTAMLCILSLSTDKL